MKIGLQSDNLAKSAMMAIRGQRDQIVNAMGLVKEIGMDLVRSEKIVKDINRRKLLNIVILYLIIMLLFITNLLVVYFKFHF